MLGFCDDVLMRCVRDVVGETPTEIAARVDTFVKLVSPFMGGAQWKVPLGRRWTGDPAHDVASVAGLPFVNVSGAVEPQMGTVFSLTADPGMTMDLIVLAGSPYVGRRNPLVRTSLRVWNPDLIDGGIFEALFHAMVDAWEPVAVAVGWNSPVDPEGHTGWGVPLGHTVWLRDDVGQIRKCVDGLVAEPYRNGVTLWAVDNDVRFPDGVLTAISDTLRLNGIHELPHGHNSPDLSDHH